MPEVIEIEIDQLDGQTKYLIPGHVTQSEVDRLIIPMEASASGQDMSHLRGKLRGEFAWFIHREWDFMDDDDRKEYPECSEYSDYYSDADEGDPGALPFTSVDPQERQ